MAKRRKRRSYFQRLMRAARSLEPVNLPLQLEAQLTAEPAGASAGERQPVRLTIIANAGNSMRISGFERPVVIDLSGVTFSSQSLPLLEDHDTSRRVGHTDSVRVAGGRIEASGVASSTLAEGVVADLRNGFPWQASVGGDVLQAQHVRQGQSVTVNGRRFEGPVIVARRLMVREISLTVLGGDRETSVRLAARRRQQRGAAMDPQFRQWLIEQGYEQPDDLTDKQLAPLQAAWEAQAPDPDDDDGDDASRLRARYVSESQRLRGVRRAFDDPRFRSVSAIQLGARRISRSDFEDLALTELGDDGQPRWDQNAVTVQLFEALRDTVPSGGPGIHVPDQIEARGGSAFSCALLRSTGLVPERQTVGHGTPHERSWGLEALYDEQALEASHAPQVRRHASLWGYMDVICAMAGTPYSGNRRAAEFGETYLRAVRRLQAASLGTTTQEASNVLEDAARKALLAAWQAQEVVWPAITGRANLQDFKTHNRYRLTVGTGKGGYEKVNTDGELTHGALSDSKVSLRADTYGMLVTLDRQTMINDDLGAFMQIPTGIGRLARLRIEEEVLVVLLTNANNFFHADNSNYGAGAAYALSIDGLTEAERLFADQTDANSLPILINPQTLLTGTNLAVTAANLFHSAEIRPTADTSDRTPIGNPHAGKFRPIKSPYLNNTGVLRMDGSAIPNQSSTGYYLFADPSIVAAIVVGFLNNQAEPTLQPIELPPDTLGQGWRSYHDWGVGQGSPEGAVWMDGTD